MRRTDSRVTRQEREDEPVVAGDWEASDEAQFRAVEQSLETEGLRREVDGLRQALASHPVIDMARGIVMAAGPCSADEAWRVLVDVSQHTNIKLRRIAQRIVDGVEGAPPSPEVQAALGASLRRMKEGRAADEGGAE